MNVLPLLLFRLFETRWNPTEFLYVK